MATKQWTSQSGVSGVGDWFSTTWIEPGVTLFVGPPAPSDTADILSGTVSISAADAATPGRGTLDGITVMLAQQSAGDVPTLDVTNEQFGSAMYLVSYAQPGMGGVLVARGTVGFAGTLQSNFADALTLDIENAGSAAVFTNTGTIEASYNSTLSVIGATGALLTNRGTMFASALVGSAYSAGVIDITAALNNAGNISNANFGTIAATGGVANSGTISDAGGVVTLGGGVVNTNAIAVSAGSMTITGAVGNSGTIADSGGTLTITDGLTGSGTILVGDHVTLDGSVGAGQVVSFGTAADATLDLNDVAAFGGTIANLSGHDIIDIAAAATATTYDATSHVLTVLNGTNAPSRRSPSAAAPRR